MTDQSVSPAGPRDRELAGQLEDSQGAYRALMRRRLVFLALGGIVLFAAVVLDILIGPALLTVGEVASGLLLSKDRVDPMIRVIVQEIRLPMTLMALVVGASLGVAGALMQTILANPLASPYTLGFSAAAGFGAALVILTGAQLPFMPALTVPLAAFGSACVATTLVWGFATYRGMTAEVMILAGIATLFLFQSLQSLVQYLAAPEVLQEIVFWLFGSLMRATWMSVWIAGGVFIVSVLCVLPDIWRLTALRLGDDRARSLGVDIGRLRLRIFALVALLTAGAVAFVGTIGFVGLVAPHIARMLVGEDQRALLPMSALVGALVMAGASIASKAISPGGIIPIGIVTAIFGVPFLFGLILIRRRSFW